MKNIRLWAILALVVVVAGVGAFAYWNHELRWRPTTMTKHQAEIARLLEGSGWVSPGVQGRAVYMVSFRSCPDCLRFKAEQFPDLHAAGVDTRVIEVARREVNGLERSTPAERATVAELWLNRDWSLFERWVSVPVSAWTAPGIPPADGDTARTAVVEAGRTMVDELIPLLKDNGVNFAYPLLVWWDQEGQMKACACERRETYRFLREDLGLEAKSDTPLVPAGEEDGALSPTPQADSEPAAS
ncbi:MAG: hypothetical protein Q8R71_14715 [Phenylobacterium sp.]|nr:hypothetical protein [Phenylobacterium sp.]